MVTQRLSSPAILISHQRVQVRLTIGSDRLLFPSSMDMWGVTYIHIILNYSTKYILSQKEKGLRRETEQKEEEKKSRTEGDSEGSEKKWKLIEEREEKEERDRGDRRRSMIWRGIREEERRRLTINVMEEILDRRVRTAGIAERERKGRKNPTDGSGRR